MSEHCILFFFSEISKLTGRKTWVVRSHLSFWMASDTISHDIFKIELGWRVLSVINIRDINDLFSHAWNLSGIQFPRQRRCWEHSRQILLLMLLHGFITANHVMETGFNCYMDLSQQGTKFLGTESKFRETPLPLSSLNFREICTFQRAAYTCVQVITWMKQRGGNDR